jgi:hypothetical protein
MAFFCPLSVAIILLNWKVKSRPRYVCTYDDFDSDYEPATAGAASYGQVVSEMGAAPRGYRTHGSHGARGAHTAAQATTAAARHEKRPDGFGAGIL